MARTFEDSAYLTATATISADRPATYFYFLDGHEITAREYDAIQAAALDRFLATAPF